MLSSLLPTALAKAAAVVGLFTIGTSSLALAGALPAPIQDRIDGRDTERVVATLADAPESPVTRPPTESDAPLAAAHLPEPGTPLPEVAAHLGEHAEELGLLADADLHTFLEQVDPDGSGRQALTERLDQVAGELAQRGPALDELVEQVRQPAVDALADARQLAEAHEDELAAQLETARQLLLERFADVRTRVEAHADRPLAADLLGQLDDIAARIEGVELDGVDALNGWFDIASGLLDRVGQPAPSERVGSLIDRLRERLAPPAPAG